MHSIVIHELENILPKAPTFSAMQNLLFRTHKSSYWIGHTGVVRKLAKVGSSFTGTFSASELASGPC